MAGAERSRLKCQQHDAVVAVVEKLLTLHRERAAAPTDAARAAFSSRILKADGELDEHVFDLYHLTKAERDHVRGAA